MTADKRLEFLDEFNNVTPVALTEAQKERMTHYQVPPPSPAKVKLADMNYVIRVRGQEYAIAGFNLLTDGYVSLNHLKWVSGQFTIYELVDNTTGSVIRSTDEPR